MQHRWQHGLHLAVAVLLLSESTGHITGLAPRLACHCLLGVPLCCAAVSMHDWCVPACSAKLFLQPPCTVAGCQTPLTSVHPRFQAPDCEAAAGDRLQ